MIDASKLPEFPGFSVYDAETGEPIYDAIYATDVNGEDQLYRNYIAMECGNEVPRAGSYIIQMGTGEYYRW